MWINGLFPVLFSSVLSVGWTVPYSSGVRQVKRRNLSSGNGRTTGVGHTTGFLGNGIPNQHRSHRTIRTSSPHGESTHTRLGYDELEKEREKTFYLEEIIERLRQELRKYQVKESRKRKRKHARQKHRVKFAASKAFRGNGERTQRRKEKARNTHRIVHIDGSLKVLNANHKLKDKRKHKLHLKDQEKHHENESQSKEATKLRENEVDKLKTKERASLDSLHGENTNKHSKSDTLPKETLDWLRNRLLVHPFKTWMLKGRFQSMSDLGIHEGQLHEIIDNKWNDRLKHKLFNVLRGDHIHLAVIGGSNTAGGGIEQDEGGTHGTFLHVLSDWWRKTITPVTGSHLKTRQIAMGGTGSDFFQYCYGSYIQDNVDVVLLEMSVNDLKELPPDVNLSLPIEQLTRQLLEFPTDPAVIYVNLLSGRTYYQGCVNLEDFGQNLLSDAYNITTFSWRDAVCPRVDGNIRVPLKSCGVVCRDGHHINQLGHAHISLMLINFFRDLLLDGIARVNETFREVFHDDVTLPRPVFIKKPSKIITSPICWTTVTPNYKRATIKNTMDVGVMENFGFDFLHDTKIGGKCFAPRMCRGDAYSGWTGKDVGASLTLSFSVPALGRKLRIKSRSVVFATRTCQSCGAAEIWLDDDYMNRRYVNAKSGYYQTSLEIVALRVNPGDHTMSVRVVAPGTVTVVGVMLGPPDGPY